jgi:hypothetical protein
MLIVLIEVWTGPFLAKRRVSTHPSNEIALCLPMVHVLIVRYAVEMNKTEMAHSFIQALARQANSVRFTVELARKA